MLRASSTTTCSGAGDAEDANAGATSTETPMPWNGYCSPHGLVLVWRGSRLPG